MLRFARPAAPTSTARTLAYPARFGAPSLAPVRSRHGFYIASKRAADVLIATALLILSAPLLGGAALLLLLTMGQSPLLAQRRVGYLGAEFTMLKLRTMRGGEDVEFSGLEDTFVVKEPSDERVTAVGRWLRRTSIDELPQLINVLGGQMSLVGPRPSLPCEVARYPSSWLTRFAVKPGLSGLWQVSGRSHVPARRRMALDRYYLRRRSLSLDMAILLRTIPVVLSRRGAW